MLAPKRSEMFLVAQRYTLDRTTLNGNYAGSGNAGRGGRAGGAPAPMMPLSTARLSRLKRFDVDWQAALGKIDASKLTPAARTDLQALQDLIVGNLKQLDTDNATLAQAARSVPFGPKLVALIEARIRIQDLIPQQAAATLTAVTKEIAALKPNVVAGLAKDVATVGADTTDSLRAQMTEWFNFYNGYDPLFTWWMGVPFKRLDEALQAHAALLRERVTAGGPVEAAGLGLCPTLVPSAPSNFSDVPDLAGSSSCLRTKWRRRPALPGGRRWPRRPRTRRRRGRDHRHVLLPRLAAACRRSTSTRSHEMRRSTTCHQAHERDRVSRAPARRCRPIRRARPTTAASPGAARGKRAAARPREEMIPYSPEQLMALAEKEYAWCESEMKKASRQLGFGDDWKKAVGR